MKIIRFLPYFQCLIPYLLIVAIITVVRSNFFSDLIPNSYAPQIRQKFIGVGQTVGGVGSIIGAYICGHLFDYYGTVKVGRIGSLLFSFCCCLHVLALQA